MMKMILKKATVICLIMVFSTLLLPTDTFALSYLPDNPRNYYDVEIITENITWEQLDKSWIVSVDGERVYDKWILWNDEYYLINIDGIMVTGWFLSDDDASKEFAFYFTDSGRMGRYWQEIDGYWYYFYMGGFNQAGMYIASSSKGANYYYFNNEGQMVAGWQEINSKWYYFDENLGMVHNWFKIKDNWYFLGYASGEESEYIEAGEMRTGWIKEDEKWYYLDSQSGAMKESWIKEGQDWYYLNKKSGDMATGWIHDGNKWYFMDLTRGNMQTGWIEENGKWYYLRTSRDSTFAEPYGAMIASATYTINGKQYQFDSAGVCVNP